MLIHLDTITSNQLSKDPFDYTFNINYPIRDCSYLALRGLEMPVGFANIRTSSALNILTVKFSNNATYSFTIPEGNYVDISSVITAVNSAITTVLPSNLSLVLSSNTNSTMKLTMNDSNSVVTSFQIVQTNFAAYILGFKNSNIFSTNKQLNSQLIYNMSIDNYIILRLTNISTTTLNSTNTNLTIDYKIPLNATAGMVFFSCDESNSYKQVLKINPTDIINQIKIQVYDRFGSQLLSLYNFDYSITLEAY